MSLRWCRMSILLLPKVLRRAFETRWARSHSSIGKLSQVQCCGCVDTVGIGLLLGWLQAVAWRAGRTDGGIDKLRILRVYRYHPSPVCRDVKTASRQV